MVLKTIIERSMGISAGPQFFSQNETRDMKAGNFGEGEFCQAQLISPKSQLKLSFALSFAVRPSAIRHPQSAIQKSIISNFLSSAN